MAATQIIALVKHIVFTDGRNLYSVIGIGRISQVKSHWLSVFSLNWAAFINLSIDRRTSNTSPSCTLSEPFNINVREGHKQELRITHQERRMLPSSAWQQSRPDAIFITLHKIWSRKIHDALMSFLRKMWSLTYSLIPGKVAGCHNACWLWNQLLKWDGFESR